MSCLSTLMRCIGLVVALGLLLSGCATTAGAARISADISVFHEMTDFSRDKAIAVMPWKESQKDSLEFKAFKTLLEQQFRAQGYRLHEGTGQPDLVVFFDYGIDSGTQQTSVLPSPQFGASPYPGGYAGGIHYRFSPIFSNSYPMPIGGSPAFGSTVVTSTLFTRYVNIDIAIPDGSSLKKVYEGRLKSRGNCSKLTQLMPPLLEIFFFEFPRASGQTKTESTNWAGVC